MENFLAVGTVDVLIEHTIFRQCKWWHDSRKDFDRKLLLEGTGDVLIVYN
jgi:hypothetical protein